MSTNKNGMRRFASFTAVVAVLALALSACSSSGYGSDLNPKTSKYVFDKFNNGQFLDTFTPGEPEEGITLEAMVQLSALGYDSAKQAKAIQWAAQNVDSFDSIGLKATYVFASHALGFAEDQSVRSAVDAIVAGIEDDGSLTGSNNYVYSWVIFALLSEGQKELANSVALKLSTLAEVSGGYKYIQGDQQNPTATDVTSFAIMSMKASLGTGSETEEAAKEFAISKAKTIVEGSIVDGTHWESYGDLDMSGTAYAIMALASLDQDVSDSVNWLKTRISPTEGGVIAPWSEPSSDLFSSAQSLLALSKVSFIDVLENTVK
jgi:hypothetical protein